MRQTYLVCYDIADEKRLRKVFQTMRNWGDHLQYSVFECQFTAMDPSAASPCCSTKGASRREIVLGKRR